MPTEMESMAHPGRVLCAFLEGMNGTNVAKHLGVSRVTLSAVPNCRSGFLAEMSTGRSAVRGPHPGFSV